jgi:hypothetical protein
MLETVLDYAKALQADCEIHGLRVAAVGSSNCPGTIFSTENEILIVYLKDARQLRRKNLKKKFQGFDVEFRYCESPRPARKSNA